MHLCGSKNKSKQFYNVIAVCFLLQGEQLWNYHISTVNIYSTLRTFPLNCHCNYSYIHHQQLSHVVWHSQMLRRNTHWRAAFQHTHNLKVSGKSQWDICSLHGLRKSRYASSIWKILPACYFWFLQWTQPLFYEPIRTAQNAVIQGLPPKMLSLKVVGQI